MEKLINIVVKVTDQASKAVQKLWWSLTNFAQNNEALFSGMQKWGTVATAWLVALWTASVMQASKLQDLRIELDTLTGSAEKWKQLFTEIQKAAAKTPFESSDLVQATSTMLQFGVAQETVMKDMMMLWDISWGNANKLKSLALVYGQVASAGKLTWQDLLQMINLWFNPLKNISDKTGESMSSLREKMEDWLITFDMVKNTMIDATSAWGLFFQMMDKKSATFSGVMSTLRDNVWVTLASLWGFSNWEVIEGGLLDKLTEAVNAVMPYLEKITNWANENPEYARNIFLFVTAITALIAVIGTLWMVIPSVIAWFTAIKVAMVAMSWPIGILIALIAWLAIYIYKNFDEIKAFWIATRNSISEFFTWRRAGLWDDTKIAIRTLVAFITGGMSEAIMYIYNNWNEVKTFWAWIWKSIWDTASSAWSYVYTTIVWWIDKAVWYISSKFAWVTKIIDSVRSASSAVIWWIGNVAIKWVATVGKWLWIRASGGAVAWGQSYLVWERGPELFTPTRGGSIINNKRMWNTPSVNINLWGVNINNWRDEQRLVSTIEKTIVQAIRGQSLWYI